MILDKIQKENDIQNIEKKDLPQLAGEIREFLIQKISENGGHLGSNLGVVELTMALHLSFHLPEDKMIWDVGHQSYTHKLLTGRRDGFDTLRKYGGMSGFPKRKESPCDAFDTGHSSTSISAGLGLAMASQLKGEDNYVISVIGDGFLYHMVRNIAGLLVDIGLGRRKVEDIKGYLAAKDRRAIGKTAPAQGLCLEEIFFTEERQQEVLRNKYFR